MVLLFAELILCIETLSTHSSVVILVVVVVNTVIKLCAISEHHRVQKCCIKIAICHVSSAWDKHLASYLV